MRYTEMVDMANSARRRVVDFFQQLLPQIAMMALSGLAGWAGGKLRGAAKERATRAEQTTKERDDNRAIMRLLLYYRLKDLFTEYVLKGEPISSADKHEVEEVYTYYHSLGGNGEGSRMYNEIMKLQVTV